MGLDMYLTAENFLSSFSEEDKKLSSKVVELFPGIKPGTSVQNITVRVAYWRKANQVHKWFVDNVQEGKDECEKTMVSRAKLNELYALCKEILEVKSKAKQKKLALEKLPPQSGFFFGSEEINEWYFEDLQETVKQLEPIINGENLKEGWDFYYQSSW